MNRWIQLRHNWCRIAVLVLFATTSVSPIMGAAAVEPGAKEARLRRDSDSPGRSRDRDNGNRDNRDRDRGHRQAPQPQPTPAPDRDRDRGHRQAPQPKPTPAPDRDRDRGHRQAPQPKPTPAPDRDRDRGHRQAPQPKPTPAPDRDRDRGHRQAPQPKPTPAPDRDRDRGHRQAPRPAPKPVPDRGHRGTPDRGRAIPDRGRRIGREEPRRRLRREWREDWRRHQRRVVRRAPRRVVRDPVRWDHRYRRWHDHTVRPVRPRPPARIIIVPAPFPEPGNWQFREVMDTADALEFLVQKIYEEMDRELSYHNDWNNQALSAMYDLVEAVNEYSDALEAYPPYLSETLYELFEVEETMYEVKPYIASGRLSSYIVENFSMAEYYVNELLWTYRQNIRDFDRKRDLAQGGTMYVDADYLNFRYAPTSDSEFNICGQLPVGLQVQVLEVIEPYENSYNSSIRWARIAYSSDVSRYITNNSCFHSSQDFYVAHGYLRR